MSFRFVRCASGRDTWYKQLLQERWSQQDNCGKASSGSLLKHNGHSRRYLLLVELSLLWERTVTAEAFVNSILFNLSSETVAFTTPQSLVSWIRVIPGKQLTKNANNKLINYCSNQTTLIQYCIGFL